MHVEKLTQHCDTCGVCIKNRHHHCGVSNKCIGLYNRNLTMVIVITGGIMCMSFYFSFYKLLLLLWS